VTATLTIPNTALNGITRMRVACRFSSAILDTEACGHTGFGEYEDYNVSITGGTPSTLTFAWTPSISLTNASIQNPMALPTTTTNYSVTVTNANGCPATDSVIVNVNPAPIVDLGADTLICGGTDITLDAGNTGANYLWNDNSTNQTLLVTTNGTYFVTVTELVNNCSATDSINVSFGAAASVTLPNDTAICQGSNLTIDAGTGYASYNWSTGATTQTINVNTVNTYIVTITNNDGCAASDSIVVSVNPLPMINLGNDTTICNNQNLVLNAGSGFTTYSWSTVEKTSSITATGANTVNTYTVTVTDNNGCSNTDAIVVTFSTCAGDKEEEMNNYISLYPNPNNGIFFIDVISQSNSIEINLVDVTGKVIYSEIVNSGNIARKQLDLKTQPAGIYMLVVKSDNITKTLRLSKY
ncbi:MAG: T9SS type A sorting domain-containing protein, partial [Bacteroidia bacterium]